MISSQKGENIFCQKLSSKILSVLKIFSFFDKHRNIALLVRNVFLIVNAFATLS